MSSHELSCALEYARAKGRRYSFRINMLIFVVYIEHFSTSSHGQGYVSLQRLPSL